VTPSLSFGFANLPFGSGRTIHTLDKQWPSNEPLTIYKMEIISTAAARLSVHPDVGQKELLAFQLVANDKITVMLPHDILAGLSPVLVLRALAPGAITGVLYCFQTSENALVNEARLLEVSSR